MPSICRYPGLCLLVIIMCGIFLSLGNWQLNRAEEKEQLLTEIAVKQEKDVIPFPVGKTEFDEMRYTRVGLRGSYETEKQFLLDNQVRNRIAGYNVLTPLKMANSEKYILIDRGWVPQGQTRQLLPDISVTADRLDLEGEVYVPFGEAYALGGMDSDQVAWPRVVQFLDFSLMSERLGYTLLPAVIRLSPQAGHGYLREWRHVNMGTDKHLAYAVQWFALAFAMVVILIILVVKRETV